MNTVVRMPGPSWMAYFLMLKIVPFPGVSVKRIPFSGNAPVESYAGNLSSVESNHDAPLCQVIHLNRIPHGSAMGALVNSLI